MDDFATATALERLGAGRFQARIPDGWQQGRGAFGGLVLGALARALVADESDGKRTLRTLSGELCGPVVAGAADIVTRLLRRGANQTNALAELRQGGDDVLAIASAVISAPRPSPSLSASLAAPAAHDWRALPLIPPGATFAQNYEYRSISPAFAATGEALAEGFIRERVPLLRVDAAALIARLDAWWPALYHVDGQRRGIATVSFVAEILADPATLDPTLPLRYRGRVAGLHDGFFVELRELWHEGRVVALNQQTFALLK